MVVEVILDNVDPGLINPCLLIWGCPWFVVGIITVGGEHPHINKKGFINPGSTLFGICVRQSSGGWV